MKYPLTSPRVSTIGSPDLLMPGAEQIWAACSGDAQWGERVYHRPNTVAAKVNWGLNPGLLNTINTNLYFESTF